MELREQIKLVVGEGFELDHQHENPVLSPLATPQYVVNSDSFINNTVNKKHIHTFNSFSVSSMGEQGNE